jgi:hypothetical protein
MKIKCSCGAKYAFEVTPDMVSNPIQLVCSQCGADNSEGVNHLIQQQFAGTATETAAPPPASPVSRASLRVNVHSGPPAPVPDSATAGAPQLCLKHPGQFTIEHCRVCQKPICPQCMALFGYVCSAFCKSAAEERGIGVPTYENQAALIRNRESRKIGRVVLSVVAGAAALIGGWLWYQFVGIKPRVAFSVKFATPGFSGSGKLLPNEAVLLHGGHLARYDLKSKKEIWGVDLIDTNQIATEAAQAVVEQAAAIEQWKLKRTADDVMAPNRFSKDEFYNMILSGAQSKFTLHAYQSNVWLRTGNKLVQYDWATGKPGREVMLNGFIARTLASDNAFLFFAGTESGEHLIKVDLATGESRTEQLTIPPPRVAAVTKTNQFTLAAARTASTTNRAVTARTNTPLFASQPVTPANPALKGYKAVLPDPLPRQLAAPAIAATVVRNAQIEKALRDDEDVRSTISMMDFRSQKRFINDRGTPVAFTVKLLEEKTLERKAMKDPPKKSALDGDVNQAATRAIANEIMNEFVREETGGIEREDVSRYEVTIKRGDQPEWKTEVIGPSEFFPLDTVDLLVAGKTLIVLDKSSKKLWESKLNYAIAGGFGDGGWGELLATARAPGMEHDGALYFFDQGVLACFELATGNVRWRQPTVGVTKMFFDDRGALYVDTTTGSAERLKYSQQVDVGDKSYPVVMKLDAKSGKILWRSERNGRLSHVFGKLIYTIEWHGGDEDEPASPYKVGIEIPPHIRIRRLSAGTGKPIWEYYQKRAPLNVDIQQNTIQLVFKKEMQVLKFIAL